MGPKCVSGHHPSVLRKRSNEAKGRQGTKKEASNPFVSSAITSICTYNGVEVRGTKSGSSRGFRV
jgi:hypothetical protein